MDDLCSCLRCQTEQSVLDLSEEEYPFGIANQMILCSQCGNKRCPHATDHRFACTMSNLPGQKGSYYE
jgi:hypothetical protein